MTGFVNALAILIFMAQVPQLMGVGWMTYVMVAVGLGAMFRHRLSLVWKGRGDPG